MNHPNIVRVYQYYQNKTLHGVIEEYCYYSLHFVMLKSPKEVLSCHDRVRILLSISRALNYLHNRDIVHNNLTSHGGYHSIFNHVNREIIANDLRFKCHAQGYYSKAALHGKVQFDNDVYSFGAALFLMVRGEEYYSGEQEYLQNKDLLKSESNWSQLRDTRIVYWPKLPTSWSSLRTLSEISIWKLRANSPTRTVLSKPWTTRYAYIGASSSP
ncbi:uncharacterized protein TRIADDRAFT_56729 [Trichoplax adhaerens]|uniref:Protein kinase domain-containing protein n=1 Tax=Trichoplax adhaerens TaxID=10228 RepID=B3RWF4_TRIAD|nr:hypothetical protein TRIADDRAFT_56729 [Trichoplax adhaerens]EDV24683.1 hypothetical protein TRIADDRAFT_56729 [Trichoplax adhaerens]|eukprot:XP_002112573.1 hypothetical protein TRIADDRAFT_56729 [Trichoplax adhaerens]